MIRKYLILIFVALLAVLLIWWLLPGDASNRLDVDTSEVSNKIEIVHFDDLFYQTDTSNFLDEINALKVAHPAFFISNDDPNFWLIQRQNPGAKNLYTDARKVIPDYARVDEKMQAAFAHFYYYFPNYDSITLYTYISNLDFEYPVIAADNLVFLAIDLYLGENHPAYNHLANYERYNRQKAFLTTDVFEAMAFKFALRNGDDNSLINEMIWWGKVLYFVEAMQPKTADSAIIKYSQQHLDFCQANEQNVWSYFVNNKLLFDASIDLKRKFIMPAPYSKFGMPFDNETPGMIGRWLGWQIVRSYMRSHPDVTLQALMNDADSREIFRNSKYKP